MKKRFVQLWGIILISILLEQVVYADVITPPAALLLALPLGALIALGLLIVLIVLGSLLVIRAIKKKHTLQKDA